jgi:hypothetical protein
VLRPWGPWYLFGAQAVVFYGVPRLSADVDVTIRLTPEAPDDFVRDMAAHGFAPRVDDPAFIERTRVIPFVHGATGMPLDVVLAGSGLEDEFLSRARPMPVGDMTVPVLSIDDLVIAKILAGRPKDIDDVRALWRIHGATVDAERVRSVLAQLQEALDQSDLLRALEQVMRSPGPRYL